MSKIPEIRYIDQGIERKAATFDEKCKAFISTLFPTPKEAPQEKEAIQPGPYNWEWPSLQDVEIFFFFSLRICNQLGYDAVARLH